MAFSFAVHGLLLFGVLQHLPRVFNTSPIFAPIDVTIMKAPAEHSPEQAYLKSEQAQHGILTVEPDRAYASKALEGSANLSSSNAELIVPAGFRNEELWFKYADRTVKRRTISAASHQASDAAYLARWRERIEQMGTQQYQENIAAIAEGGELIMLVAVDRAGDLIEIQIRRSSGSEQLDALAVSIVEQAAPFESLPESMWADTQVLEIIRTWKFHPLRNR